MQKIKILAIGNSFSENTTFFLHQVSLAAGIETKVVNLNIGGCSMELHWHNIENDVHEYRFELNGAYSVPDKNGLVSIKETLESETWNHIVFHQASHDSGLLNTYYPYAKYIYHYLLEMVPSAKIWLQQTWAYEIDSTHDGFSRYHNNQQEMYNHLTKCYHQVAYELNLPVIPTGRLIQQLRGMKPFDYENGGLTLCEDGYHLSAVYGKYAAALVWLKYILGVDVSNLDYIPKSRLAPDFEVNLNHLNVIKKAVAKMK